MMRDLSQILPGVSCETSNDLSAFAALTHRWNQSINLIAPTTEAEIWSRHILDSAQVYPLVPEKSQHLVDLGSGGGFPGVVLAILAHQFNPQLRVTMIESDARKSAFLRQAIREFSLNATVVVSRIEAARPQAADVVTARALAALPKLLPWAERHVRPGGRMIFPKGAKWKDEVTAAGVEGIVSTYPSVTSPNSAILVIKADQSPTK